MSLLLDALKKAAKDKQKAGAAKTPSSSNPPPSVSPPSQSPRGEETEPVELTLDDATEESYDSVSLREQTKFTESPSPEQPSSQSLSLTPEKITATHSTVSDEALQLLIYKTNREHRRARRRIIGSSLFVVLIIVVVGGYYFYSHMAADVESLERKHWIAMRSVQSQPNEGLKRVQQSMAPEARSTQNNKATATTGRKPVTPPTAESPASTAPATSKTGTTARVATRNTGRNKQIFSIVRSETVDPVSVLLDRAWLAYNRSDYDTARSAYQNVLSREGNNRDALLGLAAIATRLDQSQQARQYYSRILKLDPRDPIANAAIANLAESAATDSLSESKLKFMLEQNPDAAHLHFALGNLYSQQQKWPQAQRSYFDAWRGDESNADYAFNLAVSLDRVGQKSEAARFYQSSLKLAAEGNVSFSVQAAQDRLLQLNNKL